MCYEGWCDIHFYTPTLAVDKILTFHELRRLLRYSLLLIHSGCRQNSLSSVENVVAIFIATHPPTLAVDKTRFSKPTLKTRSNVFKSVAISIRVYCRL